MPKYYIFDPHGDQLAEIQRKFGFKPKFVITIGNEELKVEGSFWGHSFGVFKGEQEVASISKQVLSFGDTYEIEVHDETKTELYLFLVIIIDQTLHEQKGRSRAFNF